MYKRQPLSWLPLISDYTRESKKPFSASLTSATVYTVTSIVMYTLGLSAAIFGGGDSIITIMMNAGPVSYTHLIKYFVKVSAISYQLSAISYQLSAIS